jgi:hypothetical protein
MQGIRQINHATLYRLSLTHQPADLTTNAVWILTRPGVARRSDRQLRIDCNYILRKHGNTLGQHAGAGIGADFLQSNSDNHFVVFSATLEYHFR